MPFGEFTLLRWLNVELLRTNNTIRFEAPGIVVEILFAPVRFNSIETLPQKDWERIARPGAQNKLIRNVLLSEKCFYFKIAKLNRKF